MPTLTIWIDVDNTLLNNDHVKEKQDAFLHSALGPELTQRYWDIYEEVRKEKGVVDIPLSLDRLRKRTTREELDDQTYQHVHSMFDNYPFVQDLYPGAIETLHHLNTLGTTVVVSDGDFLYQAEKIVNSTIADAVHGRVLLFVHKQDNIPDIVRQYPADHYVIIDDKPKILSDLKGHLGKQLTTVFVQQGKYAREPFPDNYQPDLTFAGIGDLHSVTADQLLQSAQ